MICKIGLKTNDTKGHHALFNYYHVDYMTYKKNYHPRIANKSFVYITMKLIITTKNLKIHNGIQAGYLKGI